MLHGTEIRVFVSESRISFLPSAISCFNKCFINLFKFLMHIMHGLYHSFPSPPPPSPPSPFFPFPFQPQTHPMDVWLALICLFYMFHLYFIYCLVFLSNTFLYCTVLFMYTFEYLQIVVWEILHVYYMLQNEICAEREEDFHAVYNELNWIEFMFRVGELGENKRIRYKQKSVDVPWFSVYEGKRCGLGPDGHRSSYGA